jgi:hypothetical protein
VKFEPTPASLALYSRPPRAGEIGMVTSVPVPGRGRTTSIPGPGGGLVYVHWNESGVQGVAPMDLVVMARPARAAGSRRARRNPNRYTLDAHVREWAAARGARVHIPESWLGRGKVALVVAAENLGNVPTKELQAIARRHGYHVETEGDGYHYYLVPRTEKELVTSGYGEILRNPDDSSRIAPRLRAPRRPAEDRALRIAEQATSPTQSLAARRARGYGGVGYYATVRDLKRRYPTGTIVRVTYGKTTGSGAYDVRTWRIGPRGLQPIGRSVAWTPYTDLIKRRLGASLAILGVEPIATEKPTRKLR